MVDQSRVLTHQFPIRPDLTVPICLPVNLTPADAERLARFARGLAWPDDGDAAAKDDT